MAIIDFLSKNFNAKSSFAAFNSRGAWEALSEEERAIFTKAFDAVRSHGKHKEEIEVDGGIVDEIDKISQPETWTLSSFEFQDINLDEINSPDEFRKAVSDYITRMHQVRRLTQDTERKED